MLKLVQGLKDKHDELESKVDQLTIKVDEISEMRGTHKEKVCKIVREKVHELREKESKSSNVVIRNLDEKR